jgi:hypothetical protein
MFLGYNAIFLSLPAHCLCIFSRFCSDEMDSTVLAEVTRALGACAVNLPE